MKKKRSIKRYLFFWGIVVSCSLLMLLFGFGSFIIMQYQKSFLKEHEALAEGYAQQLEQDIDSLEVYVRSLYGDNAQYQMLKIPQITESRWILATYYLKNNFRGKADNMDFPGGVFFYDAKWDSLRSEFSIPPYQTDTYRLNQAIKNRVRSHIQERDIFREIMEYENKTYLLYILADRGNALGYLIDLSSYFTLRENMQLIIFDRDGSPLCSQGQELLKPQTAGTKLLNETNRVDNFNMISHQTVDSWGLQLLLVHRDERFAFWNIGAFWLLFILIPVITLLLLWYVYGIGTRILYQPIKHFIDRLTGMKIEDSQEGSQTSHQEEELEEIQIINAELDNLITEMRQLEQEKYKKEKEAAAALLQYYQLQIRPHFFLNCLNIMASLLNERDVDTVKNMVYSVSHHLRYVFQSSDSRVTLAEELEEVKAYCNIYMISYSKPILLQIQADETVSSSEIPILCIQTFVENSIKYAQEKDKVLSIVVKACWVREKEERYLRIHISDNGEGYPQQMLSQLNQSVTEFQYQSAHVGVDNIKYRIYLLYGDRAKLCFYNKPNGGAVTEILLPEEAYEHTDH